MDHGILEPLLILLAAMVGGFCSSAPLGPINLYVTDRILAKKDYRLRWYLLGIIGMDCTHASIAAWGYHIFFDQGPVARWVSIAGGAFLIILGSLSLRHKARKAQHAAAPGDVKTGRRPLNDVLLGMFMCGANPAFLMFWVFAIDQVERHTHTDILGWRLALFLLGAATGDGLWFTVLLNLVRRGRESVKPQLLASVRATIAAAFLLVGGIAIYHGFRVR